MIDKEVAEQIRQEAFRDSGINPQQSNPDLVVGLNLFSKVPINKLQLLGPEICNFHEFVQDVDWEHPENTLQLISMKYLAEISAVADVFHYANRYKNHDFAQPMIDALLKGPEFKALKKYVTPIKTLKGVRYLKDFQSIQSARLLKEVQDVGLRVLYNRGRSAYDQCPETLDVYRRFSNEFENELAEAEVRREFFENHGLTAMSQVISQSIEEIKNKLGSNEILGFKKVSMRDVAATLAKMIGLKFESRIYNNDNKEYTPISCPYHILEPHANNEFKRLIQHLDSVPEFGGKPLFDHFWVVIPSFKGEGQDGFTMVREGESIGALLGDRDGEVFFICYWTQECY